MKTTYEKALWLLDNVGNSIKLKGWWNPFSRWIWIDTDGDALVIWNASGKDTHCRAFGQQAFCMRIETNDETSGVWSSVIHMWPVKNKVESDSIEKVLRIHIDKLYDRYSSRKR